MLKTASFSVRMDSDIKAKSESLYNALGVNLTTAINVFLRKSIQAGGFPFDVRLEKNENETLFAMLEADSIGEEIRSGKRQPFSSWQEAKESLLK